MALALVLLASCNGAPVATVRPSAPAPFLVPTDLPNGRVEITVNYRYQLGSVATFPIAISASRGTVTGPVAARVNATGFGHGAPSETLIKNLAVSPVVVKAGQRLTAMVAWDGRDEKGVSIPADYYVLVLDFQIDDGGTTTVAKAATTIELRAP